MVKFFLDTADLKEIEEANSWGAIAGVTTNPTLYSRVGGKLSDFHEHIKAICDIVQGPVSAESVAMTRDEIFADGKKLHAIDPEHVVVKVPTMIEGLAATKMLAAEGIPVNMTLCFSVPQALLAARAGARYISPFIGRFDDISEDGLEQVGLDVRVQTAIAMQEVAEPYIRNRAVRHLEKGRVVVFGCGTGNPYFSTDTGAALRGAEIDAEVILKATMVDGVYDSDPKKNPNAKKYDHLTYMEILNQNLQVMDMTAASFCNDRGIPFLVFSIEDPENIVRAVCGENVGTVITKD